MESPPLDDLDDSINLESKVLLALSRLQTEDRCPKKRRKINEVSCRKVVEFLKANYSWLDGDVESQVITALLSCVKTGIVCALKNGKYRLIGPNSKTMVTNCLARTSHGPNCCCLKMLKCMFKGTPYTCCLLKNPEISVKNQKKSRKRKTSVKFQLRSRQKIKKKPSAKNKCQVRCAFLAQDLFGTSKSEIVLNDDNTQTKCNYCLEIHSLSKTRRMCTNCHPSGSLNCVPYDNFSPRDELISSKNGHVHPQSERRGMLDSNLNLYLGFFDKHFIFEGSNLLPFITPPPPPYSGYSITILIERTTLRNLQEKIHHRSRHSIHYPEEGCLVFFGVHLVPT